MSKKFRKKAPAELKLQGSIDLSGKKGVKMIWISAVLLIVAMAALGSFLVPIRLLFEVAGLKPILKRIITMLVCLILCTYVCELGKALLLKRITGKKARFIRKGLHVSCFSEERISLSDYRTSVLLTPLMLAAALAVLCIVLSRGWFWVMYVILIYDFASLVPDLFTLIKAGRASKKSDNNIKLSFTESTIEIWA